MGPAARKAGRAALSDGFFGNLYQALTGNLHVPAHFVKRAVANGLPPAQLQDAIRCARSLKALPNYLLAASEQKLEKAVYFDELGLKARARDLYLESSLWGLYAEILIDDEEKRQLVFQKYRQAYAAAAPYFTHPAFETKINYQASSISAYFRLPQSNSDESTTAQSVPAVILLNKLFSAREELHYLENSLLAQGLATLSVEYPGVSDHTGQVPGGIDVKELANSIYLYLASRPEIDISSVSLYGQGFGARIAIYMALAYSERFHSLVSMSCPLNLVSGLDRLAPLYAKELLVSAPAARAAIYELALHTQIEQGFEHLEAPLLVVGGGKDKIAGVNETKEIYEKSFSKDKKLLLCPGAGHCLYEMMPSLRYEIAQWIKQRALSQIAN